MTALTKIITGDYKQGHKIIVIAFDCLTITISKTLNDLDNAHLIEKEAEDSLASLRQYTNVSTVNTISSIAKEYETPLDQPLDKTWLQTTTEKLQQVFAIVFATSGSSALYSKWKARSAKGRIRVDKSLIP